MYTVTHTKQTWEGKGHTQLNMQTRSIRSESVWLHLLLLREERLPEKTAVLQRWHYENRKETQCLPVWPTLKDSNVYFSPLYTFILQITDCHNTGCLFFSLYSIGQRL